MEDGEIWRIRYTRRLEVYDYIFIFVKTPGGTVKTKGKVLSFE